MAKNINCNILTISIIVIIITLLSYLLYKNYYEGLIGYLGYPDSYGLFNVGTRQWSPTHLMSYDIRGDVPIGYYPIGIFNQPENLYGRKGGYRASPISIHNIYPEPNFYTPEYVNPLQGIIPSQYNSTFSVPFKVDENNIRISTTI
jgi:hypothetical protein